MSRPRRDGPNDVDAKQMADIAQVLSDEAFELWDRLLKCSRVDDRRARKAERAFRALEALRCALLP